MTYVLLKCREITPQSIYCEANIYSYNLVQRRYRTCSNFSQDGVLYTHLCGSHVHIMALLQLVSCSNKPGLAIRRVWP